MAKRQHAVVPATEKLSGKTVAVCCKEPSGMKLQLQTHEDVIVPTGQQGQMQKIKQWMKGGKIYDVRGPAYPVSPPPGYPAPPLMHGGYALTRGIPLEFWEQWLEQNKLASYVLDETIFAMPDLDDAIAAAEERDEIKSGREPLSTEVDSRGRLKDPRMPRPMNASMTGVQPDDRVRE